MRIGFIETAEDTPGFRERFGISPKAYLRERRLNGLREELRACDPNVTTVVAVAHRWGFWHLGQLARDYRRLFGELPSDALHWTRRKNKGSQSSSPRRGSVS